MSSPTPNLNQALSDFQGAMGPIPKNRTAKIPTKAGGNYSYKYADLSDVIEICRPMLKEFGLSVAQGGIFRDQMWMYVTTVRHLSGEELEFAVPMPPPSNDPKSDGAWFTYYRRYGWSAALGLSADEDTDGTGGERAAKEPAAEKAAPKAAVKTAAAQKAGSPPQTTTKGPSAPPKEPMASASKRVPAKEATLKKLKETAEGQNWTIDEVCEVISQKSQGKLTQPKDLSESQCIALIQTINDMSFGQWHQANL